MSPVIAFENEEIWIVNKPPGMSSQNDQTGGVSVRQFLGSEYIITRLDKRVSGLMIVAKTKQAAAKYSQLIQTEAYSKAYHCIVAKKPEKESGTLISWLRKRKGKAYVSSKKTDSSQKAILHYKLIQASERYHLLEIKIDTGRYHQIRAQLASVGCVITGDLKYGARRNSADGSIFLCCTQITLEDLIIEIPYPEIWKRYGFKTTSF